MRAVIFGLALSLVGCQATIENDVKVTDVAHTSIKEQTIGNCWLYAFAGWFESTYLTTYNKQINISESYMTWWHWYYQLVGGMSEIETGGSFSIAKAIILTHGIVSEGIFVPEEATQPASERQAKALNEIRAAMAANGPLATDRSPANVRKQLDLAFGVNMAAAEAKAIRAEGMQVKDLKSNRNLSFNSFIDGWTYLPFPQSNGQSPALTPQLKAQRKATLLRVMKALNDRYPVLMAFKVDDLGLNKSNRSFNLKTYKKNLADFTAANIRLSADEIRKKRAGHQGGHLVVLEDYTVRNVSTETGTIGEGEVSDELKETALKGELNYFKFKNSWGQDPNAEIDRPDESGYYQIDGDFINEQLEWVDAGGGPSKFSSPLMHFVLPAGY